MSGAAARARRRSRRIAWTVRVGGLALRALASTWRFRDVNRAPLERLRGSGQAVIFILRHGELLPLLWHHRREGVTVLVSEHTDGEIITRVAESLGFRTVRGSTTRGAERAILGMSRVAAAGGDLAFTPDGPRGPAGSFAPGALMVAHRTGAPVVAVVAAADRCWRLRSWDRFMVPKPFARITVSYSDPVVVTAASPREAAAQADRFARLLVETAHRVGERVGVGVGAGGNDRGARLACVTVARSSGSGSRTTRRQWRRGSRSRRSSSRTPRWSPRAGRCTSAGCSHRTKARSRR